MSRLKDNKVPISSGKENIDSPWYDMIKELVKALPLDTCNWLPTEDRLMRDI